jgi:DNA ligase D-like protein (predicted 3'-phosphoesterase)
MLEEYRKKRNFNRTSEPKGNPIKSSDRLMYVIQEHHASHLHYDFRLEAQGVLKSWAVPKGVPTVTQEKRLAIATEDHPLEYANFEGTIPAGEYGGGVVKIYDRGFYENLTLDKNNKPLSVAQALKQGHLVFCLHGKRFKNSTFVLQRFKKDKKEQWLFVKTRHE